MARKKTEKVEIAEAQLPVVIAPKKEVVLEGDPDVQLAYAAKAANALMSVVEKKKDPVIIRGKRYLEFSEWQVLARFYGASVEIEWTKPITDAAGKKLGYEARALVRRGGEVISSAENMCMRAEKRWGDADEYAVRSMAQTRTAAKALRNAFGWVAELAGYSATPAEEMPSDEPMKPYRVVPVVHQEHDEAGTRVKVPPMDETNDAHGLGEMPDSPDAVVETDPKRAATAQKMEIAKLMREKKGYTVLGKTAEHVAGAVMDATGISLIPANYASIIAELRFMD